jgi:hypothetical protein
MAIKFKEVYDLKKKFDTAPLSEEELTILEEVEEHIDNEIVDKYPRDQYNEVRISLCIPTFRYNPVTKKANDIHSTRRAAMQKELEKRYRESGWTISYSLDDGLDGPNRSGDDFWILKGKAMRRG